MKIILDALMLRSQLRFFRKNLAGCAFAAFAAKDPAKFGWSRKILDVDIRQIDDSVSGAIADPSISTLSLIFRKCHTTDHLLLLIENLRYCNYIFLEQDEVFADHRCLGFRAKVGTDRSWITGLGPYLQRSLKSFAAVCRSKGANLFIFGHSLAANDDHVIRKIAKGKFSNLYVSFHGDPATAANNLIFARVQAIADSRDEQNPLEVSFFQAGGAHVWG